MLLRMGLRNLLRQKGRTLFTSLSLALGVVTMGSSLGINDGTYSELIETFTRASTGHIVLEAPGFHDDPQMPHLLHDTKSLYSTLSRSAPLRGGILKVQTQALGFVGSRTTALDLLGVNFLGEASPDGLARQISQGSLAGFLQGDLLLGFGAAQILGAVPGSEVAIIAQGADGSTANGLFRIAGILGTGSAEMWSNSAFLSLPRAQEFLALGDGVHQMSLLLPSHKGTAHAVDLLRKALDEQRTPDIAVVPWWDLQKTFFKSMQADQRSGMIFVYVIIFMSALVALNTVLMMVLERTREFGILAALGTRPRRLAAIVISEVACLATVSIALGEILNLGVLLYFRNVGVRWPEPTSVAGVVVTHMTATLSLEAFLLPAAVVATVSLLVSLPAAWRVARLAPLSAMRTY